MLKMANTHTNNPDAVTQCQAVCEADLSIPRQLEKVPPAIPLRQDGVSIARAGVYAAATNVLQVMGGVATLALLARFLGPASKGIYDLYLATANLLTVFLSLALNTGVTYVVASQPVDTARLMRTLALIAGGIAASALLLMRLARLVGMDRVLVPFELGAWGPVLVATTTGLLALATFHRAVLLGHRRFLSANFGDVAKQLFSVGAITAAFVASRSWGLPLVHSVVVGNLCAVAVTALVYGSRVPLPPSATRDIGLGRAWRFSLPSYLANAAQYLNNRVDLFFVYRYWGAADVGLYQTAVLVSQAINLLPGTVQGILFPTISAGQDDRKKMIALLVPAHRVVVALSVVTAIGLAIGGHVLIPALFGRRFSRAAACLALLAPGCAFFSTTNVLAAYFAGTGRPHVNFINSLVGTVVTVGLDMVVVPRWGFYGASVVSSASFAATTVGSLTMFCRETRVGFFELYIPSKADIRAGRRYWRRFTSAIGGRND